MAFSSLVAGHLFCQFSVVVPAFGLIALWLFLFSFRAVVVFLFSSLDGAELVRLNSLSNLTLAYGRSIEPFSRFSLSFFLSLSHLLPCNTHSPFLHMEPFLDPKAIVVKSFAATRGQRQQRQNEWLVKLNPHIHNDQSGSYFDMVEELLHEGSTGTFPKVKRLATDLHTPVLEDRLAHTICSIALPLLTLFFTVKLLTSPLLQTPVQDLFSKP